MTWRLQPKRCLEVALAIAVSVALSSTAAAWNQYGGRPERTHEAAGLDGLALYRRWHTILPGAVHSPAAISGGAVFVGCDDGNLYALDFDTGGERWRFDPGNGARIRSGPAVGEGVVVAAAANGLVYGVDESTGSEKWRFRAGLSVTSSVGISGKRAIVAAYDGRVCSLSLTDGALIWDFVIPGDFIQASPAVARGLVFVASLGTGEGGGAVYALDESTGAVRWKTPLQGWLGNTVAFHDGKVVVTSTGFKTGGLYALDSNTGSVIWGPVRGANNHWSAPAVSGGAVYAGNTGWLYAIDLATGSVKWKWKAPTVTRKSGSRTSRYDALVRTPLVSGNRVYVGTYFEVPGPDDVYVVSAATGETLWRNEIPLRVGSGPSGDNGAVIIGGAAGEVEAWSPVGLVVNGCRVGFPDMTPVIIDDRTWVPCRALFEAAGYRVSWDESSDTVTCSGAGSRIVMWLGSLKALVDGREIPLETPLRLMHGRVMIQPRAIISALGGGIEWDPGSYSVRIQLGDGAGGR